MNFLLNWILSTIVLTPCSAKPIETIPLDITNTSAVEKNVNTKHKLSNEDVAITPVIIPKEKQKKTTHYPYTQSISPRFGLLFNSNNLTQIDSFLGFNYMLPEFTSPHWEVSFDIANNNSAFISLAKRTIINERRYFRPFYKYGGSLRLDSDKGLAGFLALNNYHIRAGLGLEDLLKPSMSVRMGAELIIGANIYATVNFGYSWGW